MRSFASTVPRPFAFPHPASAVIGIACYSLRGLYVHVPFSTEWGAPGRIPLRLLPPPIRSAFYVRCAKTPSASLKQTVFLHCIFSQVFAQIPSPRRFSPSGNVLQRFSAALYRFSSRLLHKCFTVFSFSTLLSTVSCGAGQPFPSLFFTITRGTSISCSVRPA